MGPYDFPTTLHDPATECLLQRVRGEFRDMPGLHITPAQAARLFGLDTETCARLLAYLTDAHDLTRGPDGRFRRRDAS